MPDGSLCSQLDTKSLQLLLSSSGKQLHQFFDSSRRVFAGHSLEGTRSELEDRLDREIRRRNCGVWVRESLPSIPEARIGCSIVAHNRSIYLFGGFDARGTLSNQLLRWTAGSQHWQDVEVVGQLQLPYFNEQIAVVHNDEIWIFGRPRSFRIGFRDVRTIVFNCANRTCRLVKNQEPPPKSIEDFWIHGHCLYEDSLLIATEEGIFAYQFASAQWKTIFRERGQRMFSGQYHMMLHESEIWLFGWSGQAYSEDGTAIPPFAPVVAKISLKTGNRTRVMCSGKPPTHRDRCQAIKVDDKWVLHGGSKLTASGKSLSETHVLNLTSRVWSVIKDDSQKATPRAHYGATAFDDRSVVFCGGRSSWRGRRGLLLAPCLEVSAFRLLTNSDLDARSESKTLLVTGDQPRVTQLRPVRCDLFNNERFSDVSITVGNNRFHAHKIILAEGSAVFDKMLSSGFIESDRDEIEITDIDPGIVEILLCYVYGCLEDISIEYIFDVFRAADRYEIVGLRGLCLKRMISEINLSSLFDFWNVAEFYSCEELIEACIVYGRDNVKALIESSELRSFVKQKPVASFRFLRRLETTLRGHRVFDPHRYASWGSQLQTMRGILDLCHLKSTLLGKIEILKQAIVLLAFDEV